MLLLLQYTQKTWTVAQRWHKWLETTAKLSKAEYAAFLQLYRSDCYNDDDADGGIRRISSTTTSEQLTASQLDAYDGLKCSSCVLQFPPDLTCCSNDDAVIDLNSSPVVTETAICIAADGAALADECEMNPGAGGGGGIDSVGNWMDGTDTDNGDIWDGVGLGGGLDDDDLEQCAAQLAAADINQDNLLDLAEYVEFLKNRFPDCENYIDSDELSMVQDGFFHVLACGYCATTSITTTNAVNDECDCPGRWCCYWDRRSHRE